MFGVKKKKEVKVLEDKLNDMEEGQISTYNLILSVIKKHTSEYTGSRTPHGNVFIQPSVYLYNNINDCIHILKDELSKKEQELNNVEKQNEQLKQEFDRLKEETSRLRQIIENDREDYDKKLNEYKNKESMNSVLKGDDVYLVRNIVDLKERISSIQIVPKNGAFNSVNSKTVNMQFEVNNRNTTDTTHLDFENKQYMLIEVENKDD